MRNGIKCCEIIDFFSVAYFFPCGYKCRHALGNPPVFFGVDPTSAISEFFLLSSIYNPILRSLFSNVRLVIKYVVIVHHGVRWTLFVCLTMESLWMLIATSSSGDEVNCLRVAICSTLVRCCWCISILIILAVSWCSLIGPHRSAVELSRLRVFRFHYPYWCCWGEVLYG